jgi:hypothetical protein
MADEKRAEEPAVPGGEAQQEARRGWLLDVGLYATGALTGDVVSDAYGGAKAAAKAATDRIRDRDANAGGPPPDDGGFLDE